MNELKDFLIQHFDFILIVLIIFCYIIIDLYLTRKNKKLKKEIHKKYDIINIEQSSISEIEAIDNEEQLKYYKNKNLISFIRFWIIIFLIFFYILNKLPNFFSFFAIAMWAIIITFKEIILCFIAFFYISTQYKIWDEIIVWDLKWEILYFNMINVWIVWVDENWENTGQFFLIPNFKFFTENIKKEDIDLHKYKKQEITIYFNKEFNLPFEEFLNSLTIYLQENLPRRSINNVWNFKTYIWHKYKIKFSYDDRENLVIKISFIIKPKDIYTFEKKIFLFIEWLKKPIL